MRGNYIGPDCRSVTEAGVEHVMKVFMHRLTNKCHDKPNHTSLPATSAALHFTDLETIANAECDEILLAE